MPTKADIIGRGWAFPFRFNPRGGIAQQGSDTIDDARIRIGMSLQQIFGTRPGTRVIEREFGVDARGTIFAPIDEITYARLRFSIREGVARWEKRVTLLSIEFEDARRAEGVLEIAIAFEIISTQVVGNLVYHWYITPEQRVQGQITLLSAPPGG